MYNERVMVAERSFPVENWTFGWLFGEIVHCATLKGRIGIEWNSSRNLAAWFSMDRGFATRQMISVGPNARGNGFPEGLKLIIERCSY